MTLALLLATTVAATLLSGSTATADEEDQLEQERGRVKKDIDDARAALNESSSRLVKTSRAYESAKQELSSARETLAETQGELQAAKAYDKTMQARLADAENELDQAKQELSSGKKRVKRAMKKAQEFLIDQAVDGDPGLRAFSSLMSGESSSDYGMRMDFNDAVTDQQTATLKNYEASEVMLELRRDRVRKARDKVAEQRRAAARNLEVKRTLERRAAAEEQEVEGLVSRTGEARAKANRAKQADLEQLDDLESERDRIQGKLQAIAERERRQAIRQQRREERRQERQEARQNNSDSDNGSRDNRSPRNNGGSPRNDGGSRDNDGGSPDAGFSLGYPVANAYITSAYGMRFHPILHYYKLHDGTDFSAACGTPVMASEDGTVTSAYYNSGYGNRIILNHGYHNGASVATSYNHMTSFSVSEGESVSKGEIIGYSGTTGYSTGCHMHFMVYENGSTVDPMGWL